MLKLACIQDVSNAPFSFESRPRLDVPKVSAISLGDLDLRFYSSDHLPPHFHAISSGEWNIRVYIRSTTKKQLDYSVKWPKNFQGPSGKIRRTLRKLVSKNRAALLKEWEENVLVH